MSPSLVHVSAHGEECRCKAIHVLRDTALTPTGERRELHDLVLLGVVTSDGTCLSRVRIRDIGDAMIYMEER